MTTAETDLTPRPPRRGRPQRHGLRRLVPWVVTVGVAVGVVFLVANLLGDAALFFYNADEAVARRAELNDDRFTLQGSPIEGTITEGFRGDETVVAFSIAFNGTVIDVVHLGDPPELFQPGVPVVLDGAWVSGEPPVSEFSPLADDGWHFASDRMRVKHDNDYRNGNEDRLVEAETGGRYEETGG
ncbi:MAG: cytochrome c maturation protein CcmE [Acidimicrobiales bacterium]